MSLEMGVSDIWLGIAFKVHGTHRRNNIKGTGRYNLNGSLYIISTNANP